VAGARFKLLASAAMGVNGSVAESPLVGYLESEFKRVKSGDKKVLHLHQIQQLQPPGDCPLDLRHIATLWKLDANHDGSVTFQELLNFAEYCNQKRLMFGSNDFHNRLKAHCVVDLWETIREEPGEERFADWAILLVNQGEAYHHSPHSPNVSFMNQDAVMTLYELLQPLKVANHIDQQGFLDMLQQIGEHMGLMSLLAEELDDWVPVDVVHRWIKRFIGAYANLFRELGLEQVVPDRKE